ncbi:MAG: glycosyltransferase family 39 protein [archaeon]
MNFDFRRLVRNPLFWILVLALAFRLVNINAPFTGHHGWKEVQISGMAARFLDEGSWLVPRNFQASPQSGPLPLAAWIIAGFWMVFGIAEWSARLPMMFMGVASVYFIYLLGKEVYSERAGRYSALFLAVSPMAAYFSRITAEISIVTLCTIL